MSCPARYLGRGRHDTKARPLAMMGGVVGVYVAGGVLGSFTRLGGLGVTHASRREATVS